MRGLMAWLDSQPLWLLGLLLFGLFWLAAFFGRALHRPDEESKGDSGLVVSASLGLLALLLGFTVSMAVARYDLRRQATLHEANAIGTFLYRTDLMPAAIRGRTLEALDSYVAARLRVGRMGEDMNGVSEARRITQRPPPARCGAR